MLHRHGPWAVRGLEQGLTVMFVTVFVAFTLLLGHLEALSSL